MKLVYYASQGQPDYRRAYLFNEWIIDTEAVAAIPHIGVVDPANDGLNHTTINEQQLMDIIDKRENDYSKFVHALSEVTLGPSVPAPATLRDFYAFEEHVKTARARRGLDMIPEWYEMPVFYFSNPHAIYGPEATIPYPRNADWLDFELEVAAVISKHGRDIPIAEAETYIAGYTIMNDWSARDIQAKEVKVGLGPAKGKDFATSLGPWLVSPDELLDRRAGKGYDLRMIARRNGVQISCGNWQTIHYSFADLIARASENATLYPGDVIGSGTVGTGCILELGPENVGGWLQPGDVIELEVERLGILRNVIGPKPS